MTRRRFDVPRVGVNNDEVQGWGGVMGCFMA